MIAMKAAKTVLLLVCLLTLAVTARADDALAPVREAFTAYNNTKLECEAARNEAWERVRSAKSEAETKAANERLEKVFRKCTELEVSARARFVDAFAGSDWNAWDAAKDAELLESGLDELALRDFAANPAQSVKAWEALVEKLPQSAGASVARVVWLPLALASTGELEKAIKRTSELAEAAPEQHKSYLFMMLGDARALGGDPDGAQLEYSKALRFVAGDADERSQQGQTRAGLELRVKLLGKAAPLLESNTWLGAEAAKLESLKGQVVVASFFATFSAPSLQLVPTLDALYQQHVHEGLKVLGVTRIYEQGYVPRDMNELRGANRDGQVLQKLDEAAFKKHLWDFRDRTKVSYPFVLATQNDFTAWGATALPTTFVVDKQGKVAFIAAGGMREHLVRIATQRALKAK